MRYNKTAKTIAVICLSVLLFCLTVGYAALSENLTITGSGKVNNAGWDIHFANLKTPSATGSAVAPTPTLNATSITNINATLKQGADTVTYTFDVVNGGGIGAKIKSITYPTVTCKGTTNDTACTDAIKNNLQWQLTYSGTKTGTVAVNDVLPKATTHTMNLKLSFKSTNTNLSADDVRFSGLNFTIVYEQTTTAD